MLRLITDKQLRQKLGGCSEMTIWRLRRDGKLPKPKKLGNRNVTPEDEADKAACTGKYRAIGESDRMTLKFRKPAN